MFKSGEIYLADIPFGYNEFIYGERPVIILENDLLESNDAGIYVVPLSTSIYCLNNRYKIKITYTEKSRNIDAWIRCDLLFKINKKNLKRTMGFVSNNVLDEICNVVTDLFGIKNTKDAVKEVNTQSITLTNAEEFYKTLKNIDDNVKKQNSNKSKLKECIISITIGFITGFISSLIVTLLFL